MAPRNTPPTFSFVTGSRRNIAAITIVTMGRLVVMMDALMGEV